MTAESDILDKEMRDKLDLSAREGCTPMGHQMLVQFLVMSHQLQLDTRNEMRQIPSRVAETIKLLNGSGGDGGTTLEWGKFKLSGKSAVVMAVKYGSFAITAIAVLYLIAKVHGWIPSPVQTASASYSVVEKP